MSFEAFASAGVAGDPLQHPLAIRNAAATTSRPNHPTVPQTRVVQNCTDHDADSLRDIIDNQAQSGDTVDLSQLPTLCGMADSTISLTTGEIQISQNDLSLIGPNLGEGTVTISGAGSFRVFKHVGSGALAISELTIADGYYHAAGNAYGGCIESANNGLVSLNFAVVTHCRATSDISRAYGGGIHAKTVNLISARIVDNEVSATAGPAARGGGISAKSVFAWYSSINGNVVHDGAAPGWGGGIDVVHVFGQPDTGGVSVLGSTIDHNVASFASAFEFSAPTSVVNSTISGNVTHGGFTVYCNGGNASLTISNSTIAFNHMDADGPWAAVAFRGNTVGTTLSIQSSIIANNTAGPNNTPSDLYVFPGPGGLVGAANLVIASNTWPPGVISVTADPKLAPLQFNGGRTLTHALLPGSPALGVGNNNAMQQNDQRGPGYPRTTGTGPNTSVDIGALQFDTIFVGDYECCTLSF